MSAHIEQSSELRKLLEDQFVPVLEDLIEMRLRRLDDPVLSTAEVAELIRKPGASLDTVRRWAEQVTGTSGHPIAVYLGNDRWSGPTIKRALARETTPSFRNRLKAAKKIAAMNSK